MNNSQTGKQNVGLHLKNENHINVLLNKDQMQTTKQKSNLLAGNGCDCKDKNCGYKQ